MSSFIKSTPKIQKSVKIDDDDVWCVIEAFFKEHDFISHQLESYNTFVECDIPRIVEGKILNIEVEGKKCTIEFANVFLDHPTHRKINEEIIAIFPKQCVDQDISYLSNIYSDIEFTNQNGIKKIYDSVHIGAIPVMAKSHLCNLYKISDDPEMLAKLEENLYDPGGYFIINGAKKILCNEERTIYNKIYVFVNRKTNPKYDIFAEVRSIGINGSHNTTTCVGLFNKKNTIGVVIPYIETSEIPIGVIFMALGASDTTEIIKFIFGDKYSEDKKALEVIIHSLEFSYECSTRESALHYIGKSGKKFSGGKDMEEEPSDEFDDKNIQVKKDAISYAKHLIETEFLPHIGTDETHNLQKMFFLGMMVKKLIDVKLKKREPDDRDHEALKRRMTAGMRMANLFNNSFKRLCSEIVSSVDRFMRGNNAVEIKSTIKSNTIRSAMCNAISNNSWGGRAKTPGISQEYDCFNYQSLLSNARKDRSPVTAEGGKVEKPRQVHSTHWGNECMSDTPEGKQAGLVKNKALGQLVTTGSDHYSILEIILNMNIIKFSGHKDDIKEFFALPKIFLNGYPVGFTKFPENVIGELVNLRRRCCIHPEVSISYDKKYEEIYIMTDAGRTCRPLLIIENGELLLKKEHIEQIKRGDWDEPPGNTWTKLISKGFVELVDKQEEEFANVVMFPSEIKNHPHRMTLTHCELHPSMSFGVGVNMIPFPDHNQCIYEEEYVFMANGSTKKIKDVIVGDRVINFDPATHIQTYTVVVATFKGPTNKIVYEITTYTGRKIRATYDHKFMTNKGWVPLEDIPEYIYTGDSIKGELKPLMVSISIEPSPMNCENINSVSIPIPKTKIRELMQIYKLDDFDILENYGDFITFHDSRDIPVLARILGYALSPKSKIMNEAKRLFFTTKFKTYSDATLFMDDLKFIGYVSSFVVDTSRGDYVTIKIYDFTFIMLLLCCNVEILGKKEPHAIPLFVKNGTRLIKREFLAGFHGGCLQGIYYFFDNYSRETIVDFPDIITLFSKEHARQNEDYRNDLVDLLDEFDVIAHISNRENSFTYRILADNDNVIQYMRDIGFRYNRSQTIDMGVITEYFKSKKLGIFSGNFEKWNNIIDVSVVGRSIFIPIYKKEILQEDVNIADITTLSSHQSFISGDGFCVHNSPRNTYQCIYEEEEVIMSDNTLKKIKHIQKNDYVKSFNPLTLQLQNVRVINTLSQKTEKNIMRIYTENTSLTLTEDHKIYGEKGWFAAGDYKVGEFIFISDGNTMIKTPITKIENVMEDKYKNICDISVESANQSFICGIVNNFGICVHNSSMGKQAIGIPGSNYMFKTKGTFHVMKYHQKQIVASKMSKIMGCQHQPAGLNAVTFIGNFFGLNQEDSIIMNQDSIDRGFMVSIAYIPHDAKIRKDKGEAFEVPTEEECSNFNGETKKLDPQSGIIREGEYVEDGDILIGKTVKVDEEYSIYSKKKKNLSIRYQGTPGIVHMVQKGIDGQGYDYVRVIVAQECSPIDGDKFCYSPDHDVLTEEGWKNITELTYFDKIATINPKSELEYHFPENIVSFDYEGDMFEIIDLCITPNHHMYVKKSGSQNYALEKAENMIGESFHMKRNVMNPSPDAMIDDLSLLSYGKSITEKMDDWVWSLSENQSRVLLNSILEGDTFSTFSKQMKDDIVKLILHSGWTSEVVKNGHAYTIHAHKFNHEIQINPQNVKKIQFNGKVYCCTVPNHVLYVRRSNREFTVWCGNSMMHGQKGTIGYRPRSHELPFDKNGVAPDVLVNPLALPSRMTIGMLIEMLCGNLVCSTSKLHQVEVGQVFRLDKNEHENPSDDESVHIENDDDDEYKKIVSVYDERIDENDIIKGQDASPWQPNFSVADICEELEKLGIKNFSSEKMTFGKTGEVQEYLMFKGICYYQRLRHLVKYKQHSRSRGGRIRLTHQPQEGRKLGGGFRINRYN